jgi:maltose alpha-D-glucosyltransferase / alpha-amylase
MLFSSGTRGTRSAQREPADGLPAWLRVWFTWTAAAFLRAYTAEAAGADWLPQDEDEFGILLDVYLLEKAIYELGYELDSRPDWVRIPLEGMLHLLEAE